MAKRSSFLQVARTLKMVVKCIIVVAVWSPGFVNPTTKCCRWVFLHGYLCTSIWRPLTVEKKCSTHRLSEYFSVRLGMFFSASLSRIRHDFEQRQQNRHTHGQEEWYVDSKLLVIREVQEVEEGGIKECSLRRQDGLFTVLQGKAEVSGLQFGHSQLQRRDGAGHLSDSNNDQRLDWRNYRGVVSLTTSILLIL